MHFVIQLIYEQYFQADICKGNISYTYSSNDDDFSLPTL